MSKTVENFGCGVPYQPGPLEPIECAGCGELFRPRRTSQKHPHEKCRWRKRQKSRDEQLDALRGLDPDELMRAGQRLIELAETIRSMRSAG